MATTVVASGTENQGYGTSLTATLPASGIEAGDLLVIYVCSRYDLTGAPAGMTLVRDSTGSGADFGHLYMEELDGTEESETRVFSWSGDYSSGLAWAILRDPDFDLPADLSTLASSASTAQGTGAEITFAAIGSPPANRRVIWAGGCQVGTYGNTGTMGATIGSGVSTAVYRSAATNHLTIIGIDNDASVADPGDCLISNTYYNRTIGMGVAIPITPSPGTVLGYANTFVPGGNSTINVAYPDGVAASGQDEMLVLFMSWANGTNPSVFTNPAGWTALGEPARGVYHTVRVLYKESNGESGTLAISGNWGYLHATMMRVAGVDTSTAPVLGTATSGFGQTHTVAAIGSPNAAPLTFWMHCCWTNVGESAKPAGTAFEAGWNASGSAATYDLDAFTVNSDIDNSTSDPGDFASATDCSWMTFGMTLQAATSATPVADSVDIDFAVDVLGLAEVVLLPTAGASPQYTLVDEGTDAMVTSDAVSMADGAADTDQYGIEDAPAEAVSPPSELTVRVGAAKTDGDEDVRLYARLIGSDGTTPYSDEVEVGPLSYAFGVFTHRLTGLTIPDLPAFANARMQFRQAYGAGAAATGEWALYPAYPVYDGSGTRTVTDWLTDWEVDGSPNVVNGTVYTDGGTDPDGRTIDIEYVTTRSGLLSAIDAANGSNLTIIVLADGEYGSTDARHANGLPNNVFNDKLCTTANLSKHIWIMAENKHGATFDMGSTLSAANRYAKGITLQLGGASNKRITGIDQTYCGNIGLEAGQVATAYGATAGAYANIVIDHCAFRRPGQEGMVFRSTNGQVAPDLRIYANLIEDTGGNSPTFGEGIYLGFDQPDCTNSAVRGVDIAWNEIRDFTSEAIEVKPNCRDVIIRDNYCHSNTGGITDCLAIVVWRSALNATAYGSSDSTIPYLDETGAVVACDGAGLVIFNNRVHSITNEAYTTGICVTHEARVFNNRIWNIQSNTGWGAAITIEKNDAASPYPRGFGNPSEREVWLYHNTCWLADAGALDTTGGNTGDVTIYAKGNLTDALGDMTATDNDGGAVSGDFEGPLTTTADAGDGPGSGFVLAATLAGGANLNSLVARDARRLLRPNGGANDYGALQLGASAGPLTITSNPSDGTATHGSQLPFTATYSGGQGPYTEEWQQSYDNGRTWETIETNSAVGAARTIQIAGLADGREMATHYRLKVTDNAAASAESAQAKLTSVSPPAGATVVSSNVASTINAGSVGQVFRISAGTYNQQAIVPKDDMVIFCDSGVVFDGQGVTNHGLSGTGKRVGWIGGRFTDYYSPLAATAVGYSGTAAASARARGGAIKPNGGDDVGGYTGGYNWSSPPGSLNDPKIPVVSGQGVDWSVIGTEVDNCAGAGVQVASGMHLREVNVHDNSEVGIWGGVCNLISGLSGTRNWIILKDSDIQDNSWDPMYHVPVGQTGEYNGFNSGGQLKFGLIHNVKIIDNSTITTSHAANAGAAGPVFWADINCRQWLIDGNYIDGVYGNRFTSAIIWELSGGGDEPVLPGLGDGVEISNNTIKNVANGGYGGCWSPNATAIRVQNGQRVWAHHNTLENILAPIMVMSDYRGGDASFAYDLGLSDTDSSPFWNVGVNGGVGGGPDVIFEDNVATGTTYPGCTGTTPSVGMYQLSPGSHANATGVQDRCVFRYNQYPNDTGTAYYINANSSTNKTGWLAEYPLDCQARP